jgi:Leucine-rich repeat (LRR) protein
MLALGGNFFLENMPSSFTNASSLNFIELLANNFTGLVPTTFGKLTKLSYLNLEQNKLQAHSRKYWVFLDSLGNCTELQMLSVSWNRLPGHVPSSLGNLSESAWSPHVWFW